MELLIAILLSLGVQIGANGLDDEFIRTHQTEIIQAEEIAARTPGGVVVDGDVGY